jgi:RNA polymerase sigma factor (sigma-70 family)
MVARRRVIDAARRTKLQTIPLELVENAEGHEDAGYGVSVGRALNAALATLSETNRRVVVLRLLEGWSFIEIGSELGLSEEATRMRFMRGLRQVRTELEREGIAP